ncbi:MAG: protein translocase SEC61 complex subunit gamma [Archaeoglobus sp.]|nr:MAG: protein translocase SEC61 complex subunit gamma [Archaeoglobus sp.]
MPAEFQFDFSWITDREKLRAKINEYINVLKMTRKPDKEEFTMTTKISVVVMFIVGLIGFIIYLFMSVLPASFRH